MSHYRYRGWGRFPFSKMIMVSFTWRCSKCTCIPFLFANPRWHHLTGKYRSPDALGKEIWNFCRYLTGGGVWGISMGSEIGDVLVLVVCLEQPLRQVRSAVRALKPQPLEGQVGDSLPSHPLPIHLFRLGPKHAAEVSEHYDYLPGIFPKPHPVEQPSEGVKCPLKPLRVSGRDQGLIWVEEVRVVNHLPSSTRTYPPRPRPPARPSVAPMRPGPRPKYILLGSSVFLVLVFKYFLENLTPVILPYPNSSSFSVPTLTCSFP